MNKKKKHPNQPKIYFYYVNLYFVIIRKTAIYIIYRIENGNIVAKQRI